MRPTHALWLLPAGFIVHDAEELVTLPAWIAHHPAELERLASLGAVARRLTASVPATRGEVAITIAFELAVLLVVTAVMAQRPDRQARRYVYSALLGVFVAHGFTHALQAAFLGTYTPGVLSALTVVPSVGFVVYRALFAGHFLTPAAAVASTLVGVVAFVPLFVALVALARRITSVGG